MTRRLWIGVGAGLAVVVVAGVAALGIDLGSNEPAARSTLPPATAAVTRQTLIQTEKVSGTLGYGDAQTLTGRASGTITWLPPAGSTVDRGAAVYRVDDRPVPLLLGSLPAYRVLRSGVSGSDVRQLEENLAALGYTGFTVDEDYTSATADIVYDWQEDLGLPETGMVDPTQVVVAATPIRIASLLGSLGNPATGALLTYTDTTRVVTLDLDVAKQQLVEVGMRATVTLPDNATVDGEVTSVGTVATSSGGGPAGGGASTTIDVLISVPDQSTLGSLDGAPVTVTLIAESRENVLTVPVAALVALAEGGYGLQVIAGDNAVYVAVTTGLFANGRVEVSGGGIAEGTVVGMPA